MSDITADAEFEMHEGSAHMRYSWLREATIYVNTKDYENLADIIHEINEAEICHLLLTKFEINSEETMIVLAKLKPKSFRLLESKKGNLAVSSVSVTHLIAPYGYNCFIGRPTPLLDW